MRTAAREHVHYPEGTPLDEYLSPWNIARKCFAFQIVRQARAVHEKAGCAEEIEENLGIWHGDLGAQMLGHLLLPLLGRQRGRGTEQNIPAGVDWGRFPCGECSLGGLDGSTTVVRRCRCSGRSKRTRMRAPDLESGTSARRATLAVNEKRSEWDVGHEELMGGGLVIRCIYRVACYSRPKKDDRSHDTPLL